MTAAIEPRANLPALTGIRGVAAWFVVLFHVRVGMQHALPAPVLAVLGKGYLAVDLFFMLSGFVLWLNYADRLRSHGPAWAPTFLARRLARIWPLHIVMLGCTVAFALMLELTGHASPDHYPWAQLPLHMLLAQNWGFTDRLTWNDPAWSISCEFAAYLLFPLLVTAVDWRRLPSAALVLLAGLFALTLHLIFVAAGAPTLGSAVPHFGLARALAEFAIGTILCALWQRWHARPQTPLLASAGVLAALTAAALSGLLAETLAVPLIFAALLLGVSLCGGHPANPLGWRPIHYLGEISYATYLAHFLLYILFKLAFVDDASRVPLALIALFLLLVLAASVALHHGIERPAQRALNRTIDAWRPLARASAPGV